MRKRAELMTLGAVLIVLVSCASTPKPFEQRFRYYATSDVSFTYDPSRQSAEVTFDALWRGPGPPQEDECHVELSREVGTGVFRPVGSASIVLDEAKYDDIAQTVDDVARAPTSVDIECPGGY